MTFGELPRAEALARLRGDGLCWQVGPYAIRAATALEDVADGLRFLYSSFPLLPADQIVDAELRVRAKPWPGRVSIEVDGDVLYDWLSRRVVIPMAEWALNVCVFHRSHRFFMLHAAVVERDGRAALFSGKAGSGKSTLCAALVHRGWRLLSDEVALIRPEDGRILPVPRPVGLKEGSIGVIRRWAPEAVLGPEWPGTAKGAVAHMLPPPGSVERSAETALPAWLFFPRFDERASAELEEVSRARAFLRAANDSFNYSVLGRTAFETLARCVDGCTCFDLRYGDLETAVRRIAELTGAAPER